MYLMQLDNPGFIMPERKHYKQPKSSKLMRAYVQLGVNVMVEFGASREDALKAMEDILDLEIQLANVITNFKIYPQGRV
jgi:predicted metalloendopeptidase